MDRLLKVTPKLVKTFCDWQQSTAQHPLPPAPKLEATEKESEAVCRYTLCPAHEWVITQMTLMVGFGGYLTLLAKVRAIPPVQPSMLNPVSEEELELSAKLNPSPPTPTPPPKTLSYPPPGKSGRGDPL